ncbi:hypothetical protein [Methylobacterium nigriterrae]|uniref:hypothetical protein n=1 Tax=Methylobacterium nigriterrae TaxID=3127512 RepID=UPI00301402C5
MMLDEPTTLLTDASTVAGPEAGAVRTWIARRSLMLTTSDQLPTGRGGRTVFTLRTVLAIALMHELTKFGVSPNKAGRTASDFFHFGRFYGSPQKWMQPGELFPTGTTWLVAFPSAKDDEVNSPDDRGVRTFLEQVVTADDYRKLFEGNNLHEQGVSRIVINLSLLDSQVRQKLTDIRASRRGDGAHAA